MPTPRIIVAFDLYGTLLDTNGINNVLQSRGGITAEQAAGLSKLWRRYQLEYVIGNDRLFWIVLITKSFALDTPGDLILWVKKEFSDMVEFT